jgi:hypothetical protein
MKDTNQPAAQAKSANGTTSLNFANGRAHSTANAHTSAASQPGEQVATRAPKTAMTGDQAENLGAGDD